MKKILVITYLFPPAGGVMVQRVLKFVKYLPHFGWLPTVLTVRNPDYKMYDAQLLKDIPLQTEIIRTGTFEPSKAINLLRAWLARPKPPLSKSETLLIEKTSFDPTPRQSLASKINNFIFMPDNRVGWLPFASLAIFKELRKRKFDIIFSTSPPFSVHLVGLIAKSILKKPWVVDLRDLWISNPYIKPPTKVHKSIARYIEHKVLKSADKIITVSNPFSEDLNSTYPDISLEQFKVILNGYDADDLALQDIQKPNDRMSIGYVGSLHQGRGRTPYYFLMALVDVKKEISDLKDKMNVFFVGSIDSTNRRIMHEIVSKFDLKDMVHFIDYVPHHQAISYMKKLDVLLFINAKSHYSTCKGNMSGKIYEYLATGKPTLVLTEEGSIREVVKKSGCGVVVDYQDIKGIKREILNYYNRFKEGQLKVDPDWEFISLFQRKKLTQQLANTLDELSQNLG